MKAILANQKKEVTKASLGLDQVDNTSDLNKPISTATQEALDALSESVDAKQASITGAASTITSSNLTSNMVLVSNSSGKVAASGSVSTTELGYLDGVTSNVQTQLNNKASTSSLSSYLAKSGGTMTGSLILSGDPTSDLEAATKQYVDNLVGGTFEWGSETAVGDVEWWASLKEWVTKTSTASERSACVGKTKYISFENAITDGYSYSFTSMLMRCIGADKDGVRTLCFRSVYCYGSIDYDEVYANCSARPSIMTVDKITYTRTSTATSLEQIESSYKVFSLSDDEYGIGYNSNSNEYTLGSVAEPYDYFTSNSSRITRYIRNGNTSEYYTRSRYTTNYSVIITTSGSVTSSSALYYAPAFVIG